jgi:hypothetical protein
MTTDKKAKSSPSRDMIEAARRMAKRENPTKARVWMRSMGYTLSRDDEASLFYAAVGGQTYHCTRKGWRVLTENDPALSHIAGKNLSMSGAINLLRGMKISVPRSHEHIIVTVLTQAPAQPPLRLVEASKPAEATPIAPATAETILAAVRLATGKASKADIAAVAKAIGADAAIKLLTNGA